MLLVSNQQLCWFFIAPAPFLLLFLYVCTRTQLLTKELTRPPFASFPSKGNIGNLSFSIKSHNGKVATDENSTSQADAMVLGTLSADMVPIPDGFSGGDEEHDLDCPTEGFSSIADAIDDIRQGKVCCICC
jgi:hypothetical protein